jgi:hypothetical protein
MVEQERAQPPQGLIGMAVPGPLMFLAMAGVMLRREECTGHHAVRARVTATCLSHTRGQRTLGGFRRRRSLS